MTKYKVTRSELLECVNNAVKRVMSERKQSLREDWNDDLLDSILNDDPNASKAKQAAMSGMADDGMLGNDTEEINDAPSFEGEDPFIDDEGAWDGENYVRKGERGFTNACRRVKTWEKQQAGRDKDPDMWGNDGRHDAMLKSIAKAKRNGMGNAGETSIPSGLGI